MNLLEHQIKVLSSVSGQPVLFKKELEKSLLWLNSHERKQLQQWLTKNYTDKYENLITKAFNPNYHFNN